MPAQASIVASCPSHRIGARPELFDERHDRSIGVVEEHRRGEAVAVDLMRQRAGCAVVLDDLNVRPREIETAARENPLADDARRFGHGRPLVAELLAQDSLVERMARVVQKDERRRAVHRDFDPGHAADFVMVGRGGDRSLVRLEDFDDDLQRRRAARRRANGADGTARAASAPSSGAPSGRIGPLADRL